ncbi:MAG TPA: CocE/NonD family hydrolase [Myxococcota bacterium]|nr:CocE/NonD family hydrolase [Myxococcota bacterium]HQK49783.1 CocE/NonD family hydrolase [Myxococcota bacterium]
MGRRLPGFLLATAWIATVQAAPAIPSLVADVPTRDGQALLSTAVYLPPGGGGPWPVILRRTPYGKDVDAGLVNGLNALGYAVVSQDVRGRGGSTGRFLPFFQDREDAAETLIWVAAQAWCDGNIGSWGGSAEGIVQLVALPDAPASWKCAFALAATEDVYEGLFPGGVWRTELTTAWLQALDALDVLDEWRTHEAGDAYWDPARVDAQERRQVDVPVLLAGGVFDIFAKDMPRVQRTFQAEAGPRARDHTFLVLGPWTHGGFLSTPGQALLEGEVVFPDDAAYQSQWLDLIQWFDWCLKGGPRPPWPRVRYWTTAFSDDGSGASGSWHGADVWPPPATTVEVFLHPDGTLDAIPPGPDDQAALLPFDPESPIPSVGGGNLTTAAGPRDQSAVDDLEGVVIAQTPPVQETTRLVGDAAARVWAAASGTDADVVVRISVVTPGGRALLVADGARRGRYADSIAEAVPLVPGRPTRFDIDLGPLALDLQPGQRLRVAVAPSSAPRYEPNPGSARPLAAPADPVPGTLTVFRDAAHPSSVTLPIATALPSWARTPSIDAREETPETTSQEAEVPGDVPDPGDADQAPTSLDSSAEDAPAGNGSCGSSSCALGNLGGDAPGGLPAGLLGIWFLLRQHRRRTRPNRDAGQGASRAS